MFRLVCPNGCGYQTETVDPEAEGYHKCPKANGKNVALVRKEKR